MIQSDIPRTVLVSIKRMFALLSFLPRKPSRRCRSGTIISQLRACTGLWDGYTHFYLVPAPSFVLQCHTVPVVGAQVENNHGEEEDVKGSFARRTTFGLVLMALLAAGWAWAAPTEPAPEPKTDPEKVLARVEGQEIKEKDVDQIIRMMGLQGAVLAHLSNILQTVPHTSTDYDDVIAIQANLNERIELPTSFIQPNHFTLFNEHNEMQMGLTLHHNFILLPPLPYGYYDLTLTKNTQSHRILIVCAPPCAYQPPKLAAGKRSNGITIQLYSLRSQNN